MKDNLSVDSSIYNALGDRALAARQTTRATAKESAVNGANVPKVSRDFLQSVAILNCNPTLRPRNDSAITAWRDSPEIDLLEIKASALSR
jgi:hypothetical protein